MADIQIVAEVVGQKKINSLIKSTQNLENRVKTLSKAYQSGKIGPEQYQQGLTELRKAASKLYPTHQKASAVVTKLSKDYLAASKAQKEYTAAQKQEQAATRAYIQARREATEANRRFDAEQRKTAQAAKQAAAEEERLKNKFVEGYTAMNVYSKELNDLAVARSKGIITAEQQRQAVARLNQEMKSGTGIFAAGALATQQAGRRTNQLGVLMQQTGYQVGDFAVQVQSGTNVMVALGQQATQLVGTFGMLAKSTKMIGIFAGLGVVIPIVTALAGAFMRMREESENASNKAKKEIQQLSQAISSLNDIQKATSESFEENLNKAFGESAEKVERLVAAINKVRFAESMEPVEDAVRQIRFGIDAAAASMDRLAMISSMSKVEKFLAGVDDADIRRLQQRVQANLDLVNAQDKVRASLEAIQSSATSGELVRNFSQAFDLLESIGGPAAQEMLESLVKAAKEAGVYEEVMRRAEQTTEDTADTAGKLNDQFREGVGLVREMASGIRNFYSELAAGGLNVKALEAKLAALKGGATPAQASGEALRTKLMADDLTREIMRTGSAGEQATRLSQIDQMVEQSIRAENLRKQISELTSTSGGVGGGSVIDKRQKMVDSVNQLISSYDKEYAKALKVEEATRLIAEAQRMGAIPANMEADQVLQDYIKSLEDAKNPMADFVNNTAKQMSSAFMSIVDGSKSASDAFRDMARSILKQAFELAVINPIINSIFGGVSGFTKLPSFFADGAAFNNGKVTAFADGGVVNGPTVFPMANGMGLMGEAGPEAIMPLKRGKNGKLGVQVEGGSQGNVTVQNHFHIAANGDDSVKRIIAQEAPKIANLTQKQILDQRRRGGVMKSTFG